MTGQSSPSCVKPPVMLGGGGAEQLPAPKAARAGVSATGKGGFPGEQGAGPEWSLTCPHLSLGCRPRGCGGRRALRLQGVSSGPSVGTPRGPWTSASRGLPLILLGRGGVAGLGSLPGQACRTPRAPGNHDALLSAGPSDPAGQRLAADRHRHERGTCPRAVPAPASCRGLGWCQSLLRPSGLEEAEKPQRAGPSPRRPESCGWSAGHLPGTGRPSSSGGSGASWGWRGPGPWGLPIETETPD